MADNGNSIDPWGIPREGHEEVEDEPAAPAVQDEASKQKQKRTPLSQMIAAAQGLFSSDKVEAPATKTTTPGDEISLPPPPAPGAQPQPFDEGTERSWEAHAQGESAVAESPPIWIDTATGKETEGFDFESNPEWLGVESAADDEDTPVSADSAFWDNQTTQTPDASTDFWGDSQPNQQPAQEEDVTGPSWDVAEPEPAAEESEADEGETTIAHLPSWLAAGTTSEDEDQKEWSSTPSEEVSVETESWTDANDTPAYQPEAESWVDTAAAEPSNDFSAPETDSTDETSAETTFDLPTSDEASAAWIAESSWLTESKTDSVVEEEEDSELDTPSWLLDKPVEIPTPVDADLDSSTDTNLKADAEPDVLLEPSFELAPEPPTDDFLAETEMTLEAATEAEAEEMPATDMLTSDVDDLATDITAESPETEASTEAEVSEFAAEMSSETEAIIETVGDESATDVDTALDTEATEDFTTGAPESEIGAVDESKDEIELSDQWMVDIPWKEEAVATAEDDAKTWWAEEETPVAWDELAAAAAELATNAPSTDVEDEVEGSQQDQAQEVVAAEDEDTPQEVVFSIATAEAPPSESAPGKDYMEGWGAIWRASAQGWVEDDDGATKWRPIVTTGDSLATWTIDTYLGVVSGDEVLMSSAGVDQLEEARKVAGERMLQSALIRGAHAVIGVHISVMPVGVQSVVSAVGTAVTLRTRD